MDYPLTHYLAQFFRGEPLILVDIGARWGVESRWTAFGESIRAFCFEADREECDRLNALGMAGVTFIPEVIAGRAGPATLYETRFPASSGLYRVNAAFFNRLLNRQNADVLGTRSVQTKTLEQVKQEYSIPSPDFIKIDVEGAEHEILASSNLSETFGVQSEFRFHADINGSPVFAELDHHMRVAGFMLYDLIYSKQSRKALPYEGPKLFYKDGARFFGPTKSGQVMDGDALYLRDPIKLRLDRMQVLKAACLFEVYGLNDCAAELLLEREDTSMVDTQHCLDLLAGGSYRVYMESY